MVESFNLHQFLLLVVLAAARTHQYQLVCALRRLMWDRFDAGFTGRLLFRGPRAWMILMARGCCCCCLI
ncbi:hypothetical protein LINPERPRIM_LOCUS22841 [Linum perenne]